MCVSMKIPAPCDIKIDRSHFCSSSVPFESSIIYKMSLWETALRTVPNICSRTGIQKGHPGFRSLECTSLDPDTTNFKTRTRIKLSLTSVGDG